MTGLLLEGKKIYGKARVQIKVETTEHKEKQEWRNF